MIPTASSDKSTCGHDDVAQVKRSIQFLYEERIRAEWRAVERRWDEDPAQTKARSTKNKKLRKKSAQQVEQKRAERDVRKIAARQKLKTFVKDIEQKIFKNRHIARLLNTADRRGLLGGYMKSHMKGSHLHVSLRDAVGTATLVRAHGHLDATTKKFVVRKQLLAGLERAEAMEQRACVK